MTCHIIVLSVLRNPFALGVILLCGLVGTVMTKGWRLNSGNSPSKSSVEKAGDTINQDTIILACPGRVESLTETVNVGAGADGVLIAVRVREGQKVVAGEVLALIDCQDLEADLQAARAAAESARQSRKRLIRGSRNEERRLAANQTGGAEAIFQQARLQDQRMMHLYESGVVSRDTFEKARRDLEVAQAALQAAVNHQALVEAPPLHEDVARADAEVWAAEERINTMTAKLGRCTVRAPISGSVLRTHMKAGESVSTVFPQPIVSIGDTSELRVRAEVDERDVGRVHLGQRAIILSEAFPEKKFAGQVSLLGALMGRKKIRTGDPAEKSDRDVLEVLIDLEDTDIRLVLGLRTTVQFLEK